MQVAQKLPELDMVFHQTFSLLEKHVAFFKFMGHRDLKNYAQSLAQDYLGFHFKRFEIGQKNFLSLNLPHHPLFSHLALVCPIPEQVMLKNHVGEVEKGFFLHELSIQHIYTAPLTELTIQKQRIDFQNILWCRGNDCEELFKNKPLSDMNAIKAVSLFLTEIQQIFKHLFPVINSLEAIRSVLFNPVSAQGISRHQLTWDIWAKRFTIQMNHAKLSDEKKDILWLASLFVCNQPLALLQLAFNEGLWMPPIEADTGAAEAFYKPVASRFFRAVATPDSPIEPRMYEPWQNEKTAIIHFLDKFVLYQKLHHNLEQNVQDKIVEDEQGFLPKI
jgi:hypothetical protein